jgi:serine/threonine protein kinase
MAPEMLQN